MFELMAKSPSPPGLYRCVWKCNKATASLDAAFRASAAVRLKLGVTGPCRPSQTSRCYLPAAPLRKFLITNSGRRRPIRPPAESRKARPIQELDRLRYGYSGTSGRMGLGADPAHPEGPGNFSSPGR